jgi:hypothetical protein
MIQNIIYLLQHTPSDDYVDGDIMSTVRPRHHYLKQLSGSVSRGNTRYQGAGLPAGAKKQTKQNSLINGRTALCLTLYTVGTTPWTRDQPIAMSLPTHMTAQKQNKRKKIFMPGVGFEPTIPALERAKTLHARITRPLISARPNNS